MKLSRAIFWDVDYDTINWDENYQWVICRVLDRGGLRDIRETIKYYGMGKIIESAKNARYLSKKTVYFVHHIFNIPLEEIRCYTLMRSRPEEWIF